MKKLGSILVALATCYFADAQVIDIEKLPTAKKFNWTGSIGMNTGFYATTSDEKRSNPLAGSINGKANLSIYETFQLPFSFSLSKYQSSFTKPFLQFGVVPTYKWAKLHLGHSNIDFNPYTLAGHTFLGAGLELNPKQFRFAALVGRFRSAVEIDTTGLVTQSPSFKRIGYGAKIGYGNDKNFLDLIYFSAKDDKNSIQSWQNPKIQEYQGDANALVPAENKMLGFSGKATIIKKLLLQADAGVSFYNLNTADSTNGKGKTQLDFREPIQWAGKAGISYAFTNFNLRLDYERLQPQYVSFGTYFLTTDLENITISPSGTFAKGKVIYAVTAGQQRDNLAKVKTETTKRFVANATVSINPKPEWGVDMNYNNFAIRQISGTQLLNDSVRIRQVNQTITVTPRYTLTIDTSASHTFSLTGNYNDVNDRNVVTKQYGNMQAMMFALNHTSSFTRLGNSINTGLNYNTTTMAATENKQIGATIGYTQSFFKETLNATSNVNYNKSFVNNESDGAVINASMGLGYNFAKRHALNFTLNVMKITSKQFENYVETTGSLGYNIRLK